MIIGYHEGHTEHPTSKLTFFCCIDSNVHLCLSVCESRRNCKTKEIGVEKGDSQIDRWMDGVTKEAFSVLLLL